MSSTGVRSRSAIWLAAEVSQLLQSAAQHHLPRIAHLSALVAGAAGPLDARPLMLSLEKLSASIASLNPTGGKSAWMDLFARSADRQQLAASSRLFMTDAEAVRAAADPLYLAARVLGQRWRLLAGEYLAEVKALDKTITTASLQLEALYGDLAEKYQAAGAPEVLTALDRVQARARELTQFLREQHEVCLAARAVHDATVQAVKLQGEAESLIEEQVIATSSRLLGHAADALVLKRGAPAHMQQHSQQEQGALRAGITGVRTTLQTLLEQRQCLAQGLGGLADRVATVLAAQEALTRRAERARTPQAA
jgi:hypothetical protein